MKRKNIKNDKVLRAITIGLATMIAATSAPISVLADDGEPEESRSESSAPTEEKTEESSSENHEHEDVDHSNDSQETQEIGNQESVAEQVYETSYPETPTDANPGVVAPIETAIEEVNDLTPVVSAFGTQENPETYTLIDAQGVQEITTLLTNESENQNEQGALQLAVAAGTNLQGAVADLGQAYDCASLAETKTESAENKINSEKKLETVNREIGAFDETKGPTTNNAQSTIDNATAANDENATKEQAYAAADKAIEDLAKSEDGLTKSEYHYEQAEQAYNYIEKDVQDARAERESAQYNLAEANRKLVASEGNAEECKKRLEEAKRKLDLVNGKIEKLTGIKNQYYKLMLQYYNDTDDKGNNKTGTTAFYNSDGTLNIEESAKGAVTTATGSASEKTFMLGRELMRQLIDYKLYSNEDVVPDSVKYGTTGTEKNTSNGGEIEKDSNGHDIVSVKQTGTIYFDNYKGGNQGKGHAVKVVYSVYCKDENGNYIIGEDGKRQTEEKTEYYNYILKSKNDSAENKDFVNGPIYLALEDSTKDVTDPNRFNRVDDKNNFDDWTKLTKVLAEYQEAQDAVSKATDEVEHLRGTIAELKLNISNTVSDERIIELEKQLEEAKIRLDQAAKDKKALEDKVEEARKAVAAIDLSRFDDTDVDDDDTDVADDDDDDDDDAADEGAAAPAEFTFTGTPSYVTGTPAMTTLPGFDFTGDADGTGATGVLGVRTGGGNDAGGTGADEGGAADSRTNVAPRADFGTVNKVLGSRQNKDNSQLAKKIKDNEIPLADIPNMDDEVTMNWMWLLIIFLLGATGKKMYDEYKKKKEAEEAAKINK